MGSWICWACSWSSSLTMPASHSTKKLSSGWLPSMNITNTIMLGKTIPIKCMRDQNWSRLFHLGLWISLRSWYWFTGLWRLFLAVHNALDSVEYALGPYLHTDLSVLFFTDRTAGTDNWLRFVFGPLEEALETELVCTAVIPAADEDDILAYITHLLFLLHICLTIFVLTSQHKSRQRFCKMCHSQQSLVITHY